MRQLDGFQQTGGNWEGITPPVAGERVRVDTIDSNWTEGHVVAWDQDQLVVRCTIRPAHGMRSFIRWSMIVRVVFLDRPVG